MMPTARGPIPVLADSPRTDVTLAAFEACPGKGLHYPDLCRSVFGGVPQSWLIGWYRTVHVGHSCLPEVRRRAASGGVITTALLYLRERGLIDGAVVVRQGRPVPWQAEAVIATSAEAIAEASQSVYVPVPVNTLLPEMAAFPGRLAYVGLPDQVASLRRLQQLGHPGALKVDYVLGPYVGTSVYFGAIESYLRSNGISSLDEVTELRYREGEWPGKLLVRTRSGRVVTARKFYYNYLIPFYATRSSLLSVDFTNELADISVGDAWHPRYEAQGQGFSVVIARSERGEQVRRALQRQGWVSLTEIALGDALAMHSHMLDFKKRGAFIRIGWRAAMGRPVPDYGYRPVAIPLTRTLTELVIAAIFALGSTAAARWLVERVPISVIGPLFDLLRRAWKRLSKPTKRRGLMAQRFITVPRAT
jgi:coenzyme F420 hydrogenase subunit beta